MRLHAIIIGEAKKPLFRIEEATLIKGRGIKGDRYFEGNGTFNHPALDQSVREVTLLDYQTLHIVNQRVGRKLDFEDLRRNLIIHNLSLEAKDKNIFTLGTATLQIQRYAPPCRYLSKLLDADMMHGLKYLGGFRAKILSSGKIKLADILKLA